MPVLPIPVVAAANLSLLLPHYRDVLRFRVLQEVRGVVALIQHGAVRLQLWQRSAQGEPMRCRVPLDGPSACVFRVYGALARVARSALMEDRPQLMPWGAWEFSLLDREGNQLLFSQWALSQPVSARTSRSHRPS
ncbi:hypothetical protein HHL11_11445 [Ramlibacter sp. G-1-2-2]|uniref:VOC family protein n=1 Tax=Ramlibacter agri TaxID=2728837 RepID=A0A848H4D1_9BURK|nr:hypothetical protein [Ramlibacter agri]NML44369.1 hypothetical protein [Ramlibacter agri]